MYLNFEEVIKQFVARKKEALDVNGLLDFIQQLYVCGKIPFRDYRALCKEVTELGATKPDPYYFNEDMLKMNA